MFLDIGLFIHHHSHPYSNTKQVPKKNENSVQCCCDTSSMFYVRTTQRNVVEREDNPPTSTQSDAVAGEDNPAAWRCEKSVAQA